MKNLLWIGDAGCPSGFARATHEILRYVDFREEGNYNVTVLGLNYRGDPHPYPYPIYAAAVEGDGFGVNRLIWMCDLAKPDVIVIQNDGWNIPFYVKKLQRFEEYKNVPVIAVVAVDGKNFRGEWLEGVTLAIFWTQFALDEARAGGYNGPAAVVPLGVDLNLYKPLNREEARAKLLPEAYVKAFVVGNVNRNQPRKRWDLTIEFFAEWIKAQSIRDAYLYLHVAPTGDMGIEVKQFARYCGVEDRVLINQQQAFYGASEEELVESYNLMDVCISTTQGEGFGLTTLEAMACGVPCIVPDWSALGCWAADGAWMVPCSTTHVGPPYVNVVGGVVDKDPFVDALQAMYSDPLVRRTIAQAGRKLAGNDRFRWSTIGRSYVEALDSLMAAKHG